MASILIRGMGRSVPRRAPLAPSVSPFFVVSIPRRDRQDKSLARGREGSGDKLSGHSRLGGSRRHEAQHRGVRRCLSLSFAPALALLPFRSAVILSCVCGRVGKRREGKGGADAGIWRR